MDVSLTLWCAWGACINTSRGMRREDSVTGLIMCEWDVSEWVGSEDLRASCASSAVSSLLHITTWMVVPCLQTPIGCARLWGECFSTACMKRMHASSVEEAILSDSLETSELELTSEAVGDLKCCDVERCRQR